MSLREKISELSWLCQEEPNQLEALAVLRETFPLVPHFDETTFIPGYAVRRILQSQEILALDEASRWRMADWASEAMADYMGAAADDKRHPSRTALGQSLTTAGLTLRALALLRNSLAELRKSEPGEERIFRLIYLAGEEAEAISKWLKEETAVVLNGCVAAEEWVEEALSAENANWNLKMLHEAGIRPPRATTRALDRVRLQSFCLWDAIMEREFSEGLGADLMKNTQIGELFIRTVPGNEPEFIPENSERLRGYVASILANLRRERFRNAEPTVPLERENKDGDEFEADSEQKHHDWLLDGMSLSRQAPIVEGVQGVAEMFRQDHPELIRTFELCFVEWPTLRIKAMAQELGVDRATVGRRKRAIRDYFERHLADEGFNLDHYKRYTKSQRLENLYQLLERYWVGTAAPRHADRRLYMREAIKAIWEKKPKLFDLLDEAYLTPELSRAELAKEHNISTEAMTARLHAAKSRLAERVNEMVSREAGKSREAAAREGRV